MRSQRREREEEDVEKKGFGLAPPPAVSMTGDVWLKRASVWEKTLQLISEEGVGGARGKVVGLENGGGGE